MLVKEDAAGEAKKQTRSLDVKNQNQNRALMDAMSPTRCEKTRVEIISSATRTSRP
jgi:hypothetical protein